MLNNESHGFPEPSGVFAVSIFSSDACSTVWWCRASQWGVISSWFPLGFLERKEKGEFTTALIPASTKCIFIASKALRLSASHTSFLSLSAANRAQNIKTERCIFVCLFLYPQFLTGRRDYPEVFSVCSSSLKESLNQDWMQTLKSMSQFSHRFFRLGTGLRG